MSISFTEENQRFVINTQNTEYVFEIAKGRYLRHLYYGKKGGKVESDTPLIYSVAPYRAEFGAHWSPDIFSQEIPFFGSGDFRACALRIYGRDGTGVTDFVYDTYRIFKGRSSLKGLPQSRADADTLTLEIILKDPTGGCVLKLYYTVYEKEDVISRYMAVENNGSDRLKIEKCMPLTLDLDSCDYEMISFYGSYAHELTYQRAPLIHGMQSVASRRGATSHQHNPFVALCTPGANENRGEVFGFNFVYSGSFLDEVEVDQQGHTRVLIGLGSECFSYTLDAGQSFCSPEALVCYSANGMGTIRRQFHRFIRNHILPPEALKPHPVVLNTWEACYFDINEETMLAFAEKSAELGFDMLVMDDGWFGRRNNDRAGLGDWTENPAKFPEGLKAFADKIKARGIKFGIWIEPEMINPDSDLYRTHPEWCLHVEGREPSLSRNQLVLDMANPEVLQYLKNIFSKTFDGVSIDYFKWDMNRSLCDVGSGCLPANRQGEAGFRYMLGVYDLLSFFRTHFPNAITETCSGGGARYDLGMMCYGFQIWTSDATDPYRRTMIQASALMAYPAATMSCHVSNPKGDLQSLDYRFKVAVAGMLGYELNIIKMPDEVCNAIKNQILQYREFEHIVRLGDYYDLVSPIKYPYAAYYYSSEGGDEILLSVIEKENCHTKQTGLLKIKTAVSGAVYTDKISGNQYSAKELKRGIRVTLTGARDHAELFYLVKKA